MDPAARKVEHVAGPKGHVDRRGAGCLTLDARAHARPWLMRQRVDEGGLMDAPLLLARNLHDEDVVHVIVRVEPAGLSGRHVGVDLARVADVGGEPAREIGDRRPGAVKPLQHDGRTRRELSEHLGRVDLVTNLGAEPTRRSEPHRGEHCTLVGHADERRSKTAARDKFVDRVGAEQVVSARQQISARQERLRTPVQVGEVGWRDADQAGERGPLRPALPREKCQA